MLSSIYFRQEFLSSLSNKKPLHSTSRQSLYCKIHIRKLRQYCQENINWKRREEVFAETCIMRLLSAVWKFYTCFPAVRNPCCWWFFSLACRFWSYHNFDQDFWFQTFFAFKAGIFGWCQWTNRILTKLFGFRTSFDFSANVDAGHLLSQTMITTSR